MNSLVYHSNAYFNQFPQNKHGEFYCFIDRAKLNYLRDISGSKGTRIKEKR